MLKKCKPRQTVCQAMPTKLDSSSIASITEVMRANCNRKPLLLKDKALADADNSTYMSKDGDCSVDYIRFGLKRHGKHFKN